MQKNGISFIHLSDVNIGAAPDAEMPWMDDRYNEIKNTFIKIISYANEHRTDFIFISGDLFNHVPTENDLRELDAICNSLNDTCVIYSAGDMDYLKQDSPLLVYDFKSKIYVIGREKLPQNMNNDSRFYAVRGEQATYMLDCLRFEKLNLDIYGVSYFDKKHSMPSLNGIGVMDENRINILLAHGGEKKFLPINFQELKAAGFDYAAMGHRHKYEQISDRICYAGSPEPLSEKERGRHGFILGHITKAGLQKRFIPISCREYKTINYPVNNYTKDSDIVEDIMHLISLEGKQHIYTINIVRLDGCEKSFDLSSAFADFYVLNILGETFERTDYDCYIKANRNNEFGALLDEMYGESPTKRDGAKLAVDTMIDLSGMNRRKGNRMSTKVFGETLRQTMEIFSAKLEFMAKSNAVQEYEKVKKMLDVSPDVLDKLNDTWARERKAELEYRTVKAYLDELPKKRRRERIRTAIRLVLVPLILFGFMLIITLPQGIVKAASVNHSDSYAMSMLIVALGIVVCLYATYLLSKRIETTGNEYITEKKANDNEVRKQLALCQERVDELRAERRELQLLENQRKGLLEEISIRERNTEKIYYEMRVLEEAMKVLKGHDSK